MTWRWVSKVTPEFDAHWRYLYRLTNEMKDQWEDGMADYTEVLRRDITIDDVDRAIHAGDPTIVTDRIGWTDADKVLLAAAIFALIAALNRAGKAEVERLKLAIRFDLEATFVQNWIKEHGAKLVTQISDETRKAIQTVILDAYNTGMAPSKAAQVIQNLIGLTERDSKAVLRYWQNVAQDGQRSAAAAKKLADAYAQKLLQRRAETIARHEIVSAANAGVQQSWMQAQEQGIILPGTMQEWIAAIYSPRTCPVCLAMNGQRVPVGQLFLTPVGPVTGPPLHVLCRCAVAISTEISS